jgi:hypothetical protein
MIRFMLGFVTASVLAGGYFWWEHRDHKGSLRGAIERATADEADGPVLEHRPKRRSGRGSAVRPADLRTVSEGDNLNTPDVIDGNAPSGPEPSQDEVDKRFRARQDDVLACIEKAQPAGDVPVSGKVVVRFRMQRSGAVRGVRVDAPAVLMKGGLYKCVRPVLTSLHFPPSSQSLIMSYPFSLD